jgi:triosephosphate isomerase
MDLEMTMKPLIIGNWKMHGSLAKNAALLQAIVAHCHVQKADWVVCPPFPYLSQAQSMLEDTGIAWGAQTVSAFSQGAFTGQVDVSMLLDFGVSYVIVGHSERRHGLRETNAWVADSAKIVIEHKMNAILCVGETLVQKEAGQLETVLQEQLLPALDQIAPENAKNLIIAYEPVWAIGTGKTASQEDILKAHTLIKNILKEKDANFYNSVRILYGGSVKPDNASQILTTLYVDGLLIGGASLDPQAFSEIGQCKLSY